LEFFQKIYPLSENGMEAKGKVLSSFHTIPTQNWDDNLFSEGLGKYASVDG